jgi:hypothetical protein
MNLGRPRKSASMSEEILTKIMGIDLQKETGLGLELGS